MCETAQAPSLRGLTKGGKLSGKVALVTGSSQGIGRASAEAAEVVREIEAGGGAAAAVFAHLQGDDGPTIAINVRAPFFLIQQSLARLRDGGGWLINISSMGARAAFPSMAAYAPAKAPSRGCWRFSSAAAASPSTPSRPG
jgi:NAD(P)-dependent dehydrogenase (short-subunit alcohol dehydrogenase family)